MSNWRYLSLQDRYNTWKLYRDAYPEMSHRDMIKHFDNGGTIDNNQDKLTSGNEYKPHNTVLGQSPDKYGYLLPETNISGQDLTKDIYSHFVKNKPVIDNAIKEHYGKQWVSDSSKYPQEFQDPNYQKKDYINEKNEWRYNNFSHAYTSKTYADEHPFKAPFVILGKEIKDLYQGATQGKLWEKIYDSPVDVRNDLLGLGASYLGKSNDEFLKELPDKLYIENRRDNPSVATAKGKDFLKNLYSPLKLSNEYANGGTIGWPPDDNNSYNDSLSSE